MRSVKFSLFNREKEINMILCHYLKLPNNQKLCSVMQLDAQKSSIQNHQKLFSYKLHVPTCFIPLPPQHIANTKNSLFMKRWHVVTFKAVKCLQNKLVPFMNVHYRSYKQAFPHQPCTISYSKETTKCEVLCPEGFLISNSHKIKIKRRHW